MSFSVQSCINRIAKALSVLALAAFVPLTALAEEAAHGAEHHVAGPISWSFLFKLINFAVLVYILMRVARKQLPSFLQSRRDEIATALDKAKAREEEAHALLREYDKKLGDLGKLIETTLNEARRQAESEKQRILEQAKADATELVASAERSIKSLEARTAREIRTLIANEVIAQTESKARAALGKGGEAQAKLVKNFIDEVGTLEAR